MQSSSHQYSSLVLSFQPRQMRANIREEVDQLKTHQRLPLSALLPFLYFSPYLTRSPNPSPLSQKSKNLIAAVAHTAKTFPNITQTHTRRTINKQCSFGVSHSPFSQVISEQQNGRPAAKGARTSVSSPRGDLFTVSSCQDYLLTLFLCEPQGRKIKMCVVEFVKCCLNTEQLYKNFAK